MTDKFLRRQNTDVWWRISINRKLEEGARLRNRDLDAFEKLDDLIEYRDTIDAWIRNTANEIRTIYVDSHVVDKYCQPIGHIDFDNTSWLTIIDSLKAIIDERTQGYNKMVDNTA